VRPAGVLAWRSRGAAETHHPALLPYLPGERLQAIETSAGRWTIAWRDGRRLCWAVGGITGYSAAWRAFLLCLDGNQLCLWVARKYNCRCVLASVRCRRAGGGGGGRASPDFFRVAWAASVPWTRAATLSNYTMAGCFGGWLVTTDERRNDTVVRA